MCGPNSEARLAEAYSLLRGKSRYANSPPPLAEIEPAAVKRALCLWLPYLVTAVTVIKPVVSSAQSLHLRHMIARVRMMRETLWFVVVCCVWHVSESANKTMGEYWRRKLRVGLSSDRVGR